MTRPPTTTPSSVPITPIVITVIPTAALIPTPSTGAVYIERITPGLIATGIVLIVVLGLAGVYLFLKRMDM